MEIPCHVDTPLSSALLGNYDGEFTGKFCVFVVLCVHFVHLPNTVCFVQAPLGSGVIVNHSRCWAMMMRHSLVNFCVFIVLRFSLGLCRGPW